MIHSQVCNQRSVKGSVRKFIPELSTPSRGNISSIETPISTWLMTNGKISDDCITLWFRVRVTRSLDVCVCFVDRCLPWCPFSFGHCVVCPLLIYGFCLPLWYFRNRINTFFYFNFLHVKVINKGNNKITELRTIFQRESQNS